MFGVIHTGYMLSTIDLKFKVRVLWLSIVFRQQPNGWAPLQVYTFRVWSDHPYTSIFTRTSLHSTPFDRHGYCKEFCDISRPLQSLYHYNLCLGEHVHLLLTNGLRRCLFEYISPFRDHQRQKSWPLTESASKSLKKQPAGFRAW
jgi:hypothetical protein